MSKLVRNSAPLLATVALVAWCCWSQVSESAPLLANMEEAQLPRIERRAVRPEISAPSQRDPFQQPKSEPDQPMEVAQLDPASKAPPRPLFDPRTILSSLRLDATMVGTDHPVALINGRVYSEGERIALKDLPKLHCRLRRIRADRVVLEIEKEEFEIIYSQPSKTLQTQTKEPRRESTTHGQRDLAADPAGKEGAFAKLLQLLRSAAPDLVSDLDSLRDQRPLPPQTLNEIDNSTSDRDHYSRP